MTKKKITIYDVAKHCGVSVATVSRIVNNADYPVSNELRLRVQASVRELNFKPKQMGLIVNRAPDGKLDAGTMDEIQKQGLHLFGVVPQSDEVYRYDCDGKPTVQLPEGSPVRTALVQILQNIGL